jgi:hypothetical protein
LQGAAMTLRRAHDEEKRVEAANGPRDKGSAA